MNDAECLLCDPAAADDALDRVEVWADAVWRLTMALRSEVLGLSYLEPRRHVPFLTDLAGAEAETLGPVLAHAANALKAAARSEVVYVYVFGEGIAHLHLHLAPHTAGDPLNDQIVRGEVVERRAAGGATEVLSAEYPLLPRDRLQDLADMVRTSLREPA